MAGDPAWPAMLVRVKKGDEGEAVTAAQELLVPRMVGVLDLKADGIVGPVTWRGLVMGDEAP
jgi:hypothetical protein